MKQVKIALVGIGGYGANAVDEMLHHADDYMTLVGVVDPYPERCHYYAELLEKEVPVYKDMDALYAEHAVDLTVISTPIFLHADQIIKALDHGSNALCEKPLCGDEADIARMEEARKRSGKFIYIGYQWSYSPAITALKADVLAGKFGELLEMKTLVLRPRNRAYFGRGVGWAGKIQMPDGRLVYDSVANNSAAHYLFNMMYLMGAEGQAAEPLDISAELLRGNEIENFDACKISYKLENGAKCCFVAAHSIDREISPTFEYRFEKGTLYYACGEAAVKYGLMHPEYTEFGQIIAFMEDGTRIHYGDPMMPQNKKLHDAAQAIAEGRTDDGPCGLDATAVHTRLINYVQKNFPVCNIKPEFMRDVNDSLYAEGLFEACVACYEDMDKSIAEFGMEP